MLSQTRIDHCAAFLLHRLRSLAPGAGASMTVAEAQQSLITLRQQQRDLRKQIDALRAFLRNQGIDPDPPPVDLGPRNKAIYSRRLDGIPYADIAKEYKLSTERIKTICQWVEIQNEKVARGQQER